MGILASITKLDRNFGWSFLGFVLAAVFGALSLYTEFWKETAPKLELELLSNAPVLDVREKLPDLEVLYQAQDIAKSGKTLSVLLVRAVNRGSTDLLSSYYDVKAPVGLDITGGTLIRADLLDTSNEYLRKAAGVMVKDSTVTFEPVILEREEWFIVKLLVLHNIGLQPTIAAHGKVAGQHTIPVVPPISATEKEDFWYKAFSGSVWTQIVRFFAYFIGTIIIILGIAIPSSSMSEAITSRKRRKLVEQFKAKTKISLTDSDEFIFDGFMRGGIQYVQRLTNSVADPERLQKRVTRHFEEKDQLRDTFTEDMVFREMSAHSRRLYFPDRFGDIGSMIKHGFITESEGKWLAASDRLKVATSFIEYLEFIDAANI